MRNFTFLRIVLLLEFLKVVPEGGEAFRREILRNYSALHPPDPSGYHQPPFTPGCPLAVNAMVSGESARACSDYTQ